jgi:L-asparaginase
LEALAEEWGLDVVDPAYFWTKERWEQHRKGLEREAELQLHAGDVFTSERMTLDSSWSQGNASWNPLEYFPQGTVGAVVLDSLGMIAVATSTGGLTNKLPGRIGDTPTIGAGFWAESWTEEPRPRGRSEDVASVMLDHISRGRLASMVSSCLGMELRAPSTRVRHAVGLSGTGNGDSFLRLTAARTTAAMSRFSSPNLPLSVAVSRMAGPSGELQQSAGNYFYTVGEGEGGFIAIELVGNRSTVSYDYNRGMFRAYIDDTGAAQFGAFRDDDEKHKTQRFS